MKNKIKVIVSILIGIILLDTIQAKCLNHRPLIKMTKYDIGNVVKKDIGIFVYTYHLASGEKVTVYRWEKYAPPEIPKDENTKEESDEMKNIKVTINDKKYEVILEENETVKEFINLLPQEFMMEELNGNEKYVYMNHSFTTNESNPKHITKGDIMLYKKNCFVIFYKSFDTSYSYTKIGHINNLDDLEDGSITAYFEK